MVSVERCGPVRSNVLQRQPVLILSGRVRREGAEDDDSDSNQHCRDQTYGDVAVDVFHKPQFIRRCRKLSSDKDKMPLPSHRSGSACMPLFRKFDASFDRTQPVNCVAQL